MRKPIRHTRKRYKGGANNETNQQTFNNSIGEKSNGENANKERQKNLDNIEKIKKDIAAISKKITFHKKTISEYMSAIPKIIKIREKCKNNTLSCAQEKGDLSINSRFFKTISSYVNGTKNLLSEQISTLNTWETSLKNKEQQLAALLLKHRIIPERKDHIRFNHGGRRSRKYRK